MPKKKHRSQKPRSQKPRAQKQQPASEDPCAPGEGCEWVDEEILIAVYEIIAAAPYFAKIAFTNPHLACLRQYFFSLKAAQWIHKRVPKTEQQREIEFSMTTITQTMTRVALVANDYKLMTTIVERVAKASDVLYDELQPGREISLYMDNEIAAIIAEEQEYEAERACEVQACESSPALDLATYSFVAMQQAPVRRG